MIENIKILKISLNDASQRLSIRKSKDMLGRELGMVPTVNPQYIDEYQNIYENDILKNNKNNTLGIFGNIFQNNIRNIIELTPQKVVIQSVFITILSIK